MVSRRNFFSIFIMMAVIFFMFQFYQVAREGQSGYGVNIHISEEVLSGSNRWKLAEDWERELDIDFVVLFSQRGGPVETVVSQWCEYTKRALLVYSEMEEYVISMEHLPEVVLVDAETVRLPDEMLFFEEITDLGVTLIFCNLPSPQIIKGMDDLQKLLGIQSVRQDTIEVEGVHLLSGFLLGGEGVYRAETEKDVKLQDLELNVPWYITAGGTKTYMVGLLDKLLEDEEAKNEYFPGLIWRNGYKKSSVFVVNGSYMESMMGIGILDAMMYEAKPYVIYPVVNAQNITVANFPSFSGESDEKMKEMYSRDTKGVLQNICWPALSGMATRSQYRMTCLMTAQYDYMDNIEPFTDTLPFYLQEFREVNAEAGISLKYADTADLTVKLERDEVFYSSMEEDYVYSAVFAEEKDLGQLGAALPAQPFLKTVRTIASQTPENAPIISYYNDDITLQSVTSVASKHTYSDNLRLKCYETALGYSNVLVDMHNILWPENEEDRWENASEDMVSNLDTYWKPFSDFQNTTLSESDARIRALLNLDYQDNREGDTIRLQVSNVDEGWFLLRTHGERIADIDGGEYQEVEADAYLIHAQQASVVISLERDRGGVNYSVN
ncbi:MAG: DUF2194 domain-containing protein [Acetatifactor sp.]|nr:DUF2194 domain-containing protein [Acetatifactor sp.]